MAIKAKATRTTECEICGCSIKRHKTFAAKCTGDADLAAAKELLAAQCRSWSLTSKQKHCGVCWSIVSAS